MKPKVIDYKDEYCQSCGKLHLRGGHDFFCWPCEQRIERLKEDLEQLGINQSIAMKKYTYYINGNYGNGTFTGKPCKDLEDMLDCIKEAIAKGVKIINVRIEDSCKCGKKISNCHD